MLVASRTGNLGRVRFDLGADTEEERAQLEALVTALAGGEVTRQDLARLRAVLESRLRVSSVGFDPNGRLMSITFESP